MDFDTLTLSRLQFALTIMFHYLFPPLSIGLGVLMVMMEGRYLWTGDRDYEAMTKFWTKIFAANFAVGVASGLVMEFQFGTNWSRYSRFVGDVFGSALAAEGIFAFFLESGFLAVLVFGWDRVSPRMHFFATCMVALGSMFSAIWIVVANSWQHTPAGFHLVEHGGVMRAEITDFWAMVFNPSSMHRLIHVLLGSWILGAFFVTSITAWYLLRRQHEQFARKGFMLALWFGVFSLAAMAVSGHFQARNMARTQPAKLAAFEAHFHSSPGGTPMVLAGLPNVRERRIDYAVEVPGLLSFLVYDNWQQPVAALDQFPPADQPPVMLPFVAYRLMLAGAASLTLLALLGLVAWWRGRLFTTRWLLWLFVLAAPIPYVANQAGWVATEVGRQPWVVYGLLRTADAHSPRVPAGEVAASIIMFGIIYLLLFIVWLYVLNSKIQHGPDAADLAAMEKKPADKKPADQKQRDKAASDPVSSILDVAARKTSAGDVSLTSGRDDSKKEN
jgi:cytochrome d ubiquinol oxidase subunit I